MCVCGSRGCATDVYLCVHASMFETDIGVFFWCFFVPRCPSQIITITESDDFGTCHSLFEEQWDNNEVE